MTEEPERRELLLTVARHIVGLIYALASILGGELICLVASALMRGDDD